MGRTTSCKRWALLRAETANKARAGMEIIIERVAYRARCRRYAMMESQPAWVLHEYVA